MLISKILLQQCWKAKTDWDESVPHALQNVWQSFSEQLALIDNLEINRNVLINDAINVQLHGFSNASKAAYGDCIYGRVAPLAEQTMPRLELCGALMLAQLYNEIHAILTFKPNKIIFWSDSTIALLSWLNKHPSKLKQFEANRVREIQKVSEGIE
ncbi:uncharacterized protein LOC114927846 [Nylanderia fulva]|uniref:uncharacterized protein LOC114927846 n=1 Tax=Nylanderia fulva TaxID=613905 RepID=UPI0010FB4C80|nr:uncharacterized protein LOC114927846 [Nylanderia fulva]